MPRSLYGDSFDTFLMSLLDRGAEEVFHLPQKIQLPIAQIIKERQLGLLTLYYLYMTSSEDPRSILMSNSEFDITNYKTPVKTYKLENIDKEFAKIFGLHSSHQEKFTNSKKK